MPKEPRGHFDPMATFLSGEVRVARRSGGTSEPRAPCQVGARTTPRVRLRCEEFGRRGIGAPCPSGCRIPHIIPALVHGSKSQVWQRWVDFQYAIAVPNYGIETQPRYETPGVVSQWTLANTVSTSRLGAVSPQTQPRDLARPTHSHGGLCSGRSSLSLGRHLTKPWVCDARRSIAGFFSPIGPCRRLALRPFRHTD